MSSCVACAQLQVLDHTAFETLAPEWDALLQRSYDNRIFLSPTWFNIWWRHFGDGNARIVTLRDGDGALVGLLPLQLTDGVLGLVGDYNVADYMDGIALKHRARDLLVAMWSHVFDELAFDAISLHHVPSASPLLPALQEVAGTRGMTLGITDEEVCPVAILCSNWEGYLQMLTKKQRHEIRRKLRRAQDGVEWEWRTASTEDDLAVDLPIFFHLHEASASDKGRFMTPRMQTFFEDLASRLLADGILRLSIFSREGRDIATSMAFFYRGRYMLYNSGYDPDRAQYSPGIAAVALAMQDAIAHKAVAFDFLSGGEAYKYQFGATNTYTSRVHLPGS